MSRARILLLLSLALCAAVIYAWIATPKQRSVGSGQEFGRKVGLQRQAPSALPVVVDLDFSRAGDSRYREPRKNLFGPIYRPPKVVKKRPAPPPKIIKPVKKPMKVVPVVATPSGPEPIQPLEVLGYLNKAQDYTVFLATKSGDVFLVKSGDVFANDLVVRGIDTRQITIGRRQTDQQVALSLGEVKSQRLPTVRYQSDRPRFEMPQKFSSDKPEPDAGPEQGTEKVEQ